MAKLEETVASLKDTINLQQNTYRMFDQKLNTLIQTSNQGSNRNQQPFNYGQRSGAYAPPGLFEIICFYCSKHGHRLMDCPHVQAHIGKGWIRHVLGQLRLPDGRTIPRDGNKSMKEVVEGLNKTVPGLILTAAIPNEHFYQGNTQARVGDKEGEAAEVLINLVQQISLDGLK